MQEIVEIRVASAMSEVISESASVCIKKHHKTDSMYHSNQPTEAGIHKS